MDASPFSYLLRPTSGVVTVDDAGRLLLVRRSDDGSWCLPGGGVEPGESWSQAAIRECQEETGWLVRIVSLFGVYSDPKSQVHFYPDGRHVQFLSVVFRAELVERVGRASSETVEVAFFDLDNLPNPLFQGDIPVLEDLISTDSPPFIH